MPASNKPTKMNIDTISMLIQAARPVSEEDYGSELQITLENRVYEYVESILDAKQMEGFENYCNKATVNERLDAALYVINGDVSWLTKWEDIPEAPEHLRCNLEDM